MANDNYPTDKRIMDLFSDWFDPCPLCLDNEYKNDALSMEDWEDKTFVNPPYSDPKPWINKAIKEAKKGRTIVMLLRMDTSTKWFWRLQEAGAIFLWVNGRLKFETGKSAPFPSMIAILNKEKIFPKNETKGSKSTSDWKW